VAATVPVERPGAASPLLEVAQSIGEPPGEDTTPAGHAEPVEGSFERFMGSFGNPARWAGR
jgi:hypothetical protein